MKKPEKTWKKVSHHYNTEPVVFLSLKTTQFLQERGNYEKSLFSF
jgi:hypothetical protein